MGQVYLIQRDSEKEEQKETDIKQRNEKKNKKFLQGILEDQLNENITREDKNKSPIDY